MKTTTFMATSICFVALAATGLSADDLAATLPASGMHGVEEFNHRVAGLTLTVEDAGWPSLSMLENPYSIPGALAGVREKPGSLNPGPFAFGTVAAGENGRLASQQANKVSNTQTFAGDGGASVSITISRLSPAVLIESASPSIELFATEAKPLHGTSNNVVPPPAGSITPLRWAAPEPGGKVLTGVLGKQTAWDLPWQTWAQRVAKTESAATERHDAAQLPVPTLDKNWLLLWYGSDSPFVSSKVSSTYMPNNNFHPLSPFRMNTIFQADVPFLVVFERAPKSISFSKGSNGHRLVIENPEGVGKIALLPLFGHDVRPATETERWLVEFPDAVKARCSAWADLLGTFPVNVTETSAYDEAKDLVMLSESFEFVPVRPGAKPTAPLPPMLAVAHTQGMPLVFDGKPIDLHLATEFGPMMGIPGEKFTWSLAGLGKAVRERPVPGPSNPKAAELEKELVAEVDKLVQAGHLAPWICHMRRFGFCYFRDPSESLGLLCDLLPVLPGTTRERLTEYLRREYAAYPPEKVEYLSVVDGVRREIRGELPPRRISYESFSYEIYSTGSPSVIHDPQPALSRAWAVARYLEAVGVKPSAESMTFWNSALANALSDREWSTLAWQFGKYTVRRVVLRTKPGDSALCREVRLRYISDVARHVHRDTAGLIGYLRLCRMSGQPEPPEVWGQLARLAALRYALARYGRYVATSGLFEMPSDPQARAYLESGGYDFTRPENHTQQILHLDQFGVQFDMIVTRKLSGYRSSSHDTNAYGFSGHEYSFLDLTPEFARIMSGLGLTEDSRRFLDLYTSIQTTWFTTLGDNCQLGSELAYMFPSDAHQMFMAQAWLAGAPPEKLERNIDVAWTPVGDLFYMHKLAETIKAYRGTQWK